MTKTAYIIGMGPAGLASALSVLSRGYSVVLIDRSPEEELFRRRQGVFLEEMTITDFFALTQLAAKGYALEFREENFYCRLHRPQNEASQELSEEDRLDLAFFELIEKEHTVIPVGELQRYQFNKLHYIYNRGYYTFHDQEEPYTVVIDREKQSLIVHMGDADIVHVDAEKQKICLNIKGKEETQRFKLLINATGRTSKSFSLDWNKNNPAFTIGYMKLENPEHNAFAVMHLSISQAPLKLLAKPVLTPIDSSSLIPAKNMEPLRGLGWHHERTPLIFIKYSKEYETVYISGEIPADMLKRQNEEELKRWFDLVMRQLFNNGHFKTRIIEPPSTFSMSVELADRQVVPLPYGGVYCVTGDALMSANFLLGYGVSNALEDASELYDMLGKGIAETDHQYRNSRWEEYRKGWSSFKKFISSRTNMFQLESLADHLINLKEESVSEFEALQQSVDELSMPACSYR